MNIKLLSFSGLAALALVNTNAAAAIGLVTWVMIDAIRGHVSISGACVGPIIGLVAVTPACGFIQPGWSLLIGFIATCVVYLLILLKRYMRFDDTLDVALVHGGGMSKYLMFVSIRFILFRRYIRSIHDWSFF
jgi:Amt family ammonium transporter